MRKNRHGQKIKPYKQVEMIIDELHEVWVARLFKEGSAEIGPPSQYGNLVRCKQSDGGRVGDNIIVAPRG
jgi:hypothetical protein